MNDINTGGPAFPELGNVAYKSDWQSESGMTLRDYLAAKAMQGDWAAQSNETGFFSNDAAMENLEARAKVYYRMADAMLKVWCQS